MVVNRWTSSDDGPDTADVALWVYGLASFGIVLGAILIIAAFTAVIGGLK